MNTLRMRLRIFLIRVFLAAGQIFRRLIFYVAGFDRKLHSRPACWPWRFPPGASGPDALAIRAICLRVVQITGRYSFATLFPVGVNDFRLSPPGACSECPYIQINACCRTGQQVKTESLQRIERFGGVTKSPASCV